MTAKSTHIRSCYRILYPDGCTFAVLGSFGYSSQLVQSPINGKNAKSSSLSSPPFLGSMWYTSWTFFHYNTTSSSRVRRSFFRVLLMFQLSSALFAPNLSTKTTTFFLRSSRFVCRLWIECDIIYSQKLSEEEEWEWIQFYRPLIVSTIFRLCYDADIALKHDMKRDHNEAQLKWINSKSR